MLRLWHTSFLHMQLLVTSNDAGDFNVAWRRYALWRVASSL